MKKKILLTRPRASSERWAALLAQRGFDSAVEPLLTIAPTHAPRPIGQFQAVMITSFNALDALQDWKETVGDLLPLPCFCVGMATGEAARVFGFTDIRCGTSDSAGLAQAMVEALADKALPILHIAGDIVDGKGEDILSRAGVTLTLWPVYQANAAADFSAATVSAFRNNDIAAIPVFSPRSARVLVGLVEKNRLALSCHGIVAVALSQPVADVLQTLPWQRLIVAKHPTEEDVLACLQSEASMTDNAPKIPSKPAPVLPPPAAPRKKTGNRLAWGFLGVLVLAGAISGAILQSKGMRDDHATPAAAPDTQSLDALQKRVQILESRMDEHDEIPAPSPSVAAATAPDTANLAALAENVKTLQAQITSMQAQTQKTVAAAFAFWDLRQAANGGHSFVSQLAALRSASDDKDVIEQALKLEPFAASGAPTLPQLHEQLTAQEPASAAALPEEPTLAERAKSVLGHLVSIRPLHSPEFANLENALDQGNAQEAMDDFKVLPPETRQKLAPWQEKLAARMAVDDALQNLTSHFAAAQRTTP